MYNFNHRWDEFKLITSFSFLKCNGIFEKIGGLILGKYEKFDDKNSNLKPYDVLKELIGNDKNRIPILANVDCSHTHPMFTMPIGSKITLDAACQKIYLISLGA
jgi:muramoyltetrapeptide carboxypeptidase LdcA involved in peptidoglycan recycling